MKRALLVSWLALLVALVHVVAACGDQAAGPGGRSSSESYPEGKLSISVSMLDVGLLKGDAMAEAKEGWRVAALKVTAADPKSASWGVLEFPEGVGSRSASEFFEVQVQELTRGDQLEITVTATFESDAGEEVVRQATDRWPP